MSRLPPTRLVVAALALAAGMNVTNPTSARDINGPQTIFGGDRPGAERQARAEWRRVPPAEMTCVDQRLKHKGSSIEALVRRGVIPSAARLIQLRSTCRDFVESVQMDTAAAFGSDAAGLLRRAKGAGIQFDQNEEELERLAELQDIVNDAEREWAGLEQEGRAPTSASNARVRRASASPGRRS
jgi:hypothetical protein